MTEDQCCKSLLKIGFWLSLMYIYGNILKLVCTTIYIFDLEHTDNYNDLQDYYSMNNQTLVHTSTIAPLTLSAIMMYALYLYMCVNCCNILINIDIVGYFGSMLFWVSFGATLFTFDLIRNTSIIKRCIECDPYDLDNSHLYIISYSTRSASLVGIILVCLAAWSVDLHSHRCGIRVCEYLLFPLFILCMGFICCFNSNMGDSDSNIELNYPVQVDNLDSVKNTNLESIRIDNLSINSRYNQMI